MNTEAMDPTIGIRAILLVVVVLVTLGMAVRLVIAFRKLSLGQKLFFIGALCMTAYAGDAMRAAIEAGLEWRWRLIMAFVGSACLFGWMLEPLALQRRLWGQASFAPPPDRSDGRPNPESR